MTRSGALKGPTLSINDFRKWWYKCPCYCHQIATLTKAGVTISEQTTDGMIKMWIRNTKPTAHSFFSSNSQKYWTSTCCDDSLKVCVLRKHTLSHAFAKLVCSYQTTTSTDGWRQFSPHVLTLTCKESLDAALPHNHFHHTVGWRGLCWHYRNKHAHYSLMLGLYFKICILNSKHF